VIETKFQNQYKTEKQTRTTSQLQINYKNLVIKADSNPKKMILLKL